MGDRAAMTLPQNPQVPIERWLSVAGHEGVYEVSDMGRVRSLDRVLVTSHGVSRRLKGKMLSPTGGEYLSVGLGSHPIRVHKLVAEAFLGPRPAGQEVRHLNGNHHDCRLVNLSYGTRAEQRQDDLRNGVHHNANKTQCKWGHPYTLKNTYRRKDGSRDCWQCIRERNHGRCVSAVS